MSPTERQPQARPLPLRHAPAGQAADRRHEIAAAELSEHAASICRSYRPTAPTPSTSLAGLLRSALQCQNEPDTERPLFMTFTPSMRRSVEASYQRHLTRDVPRDSAD